MGKYNVSKNMEWAIPYLKVAESVVPLRGVRFEGYRVPVGRTPRILGITHKFETGRRKIRICLARNPEGNEGRHELYELETLLTTLAHEIAHLKHWPHNADHLALTAMIFCLFADEAHRQGIKDTNRSPRIE